MLEPRKVPVPKDEVLGGRFAAWAAGAAPGLLRAEPVAGPVGDARWTPATGPVPVLAVARAGRSVDPSWRRTSYSALTATAHETPGVSSEPEEEGTTDEPPPPQDEGAAEGLASTMNALPGGAAFGTLVHEVLEELDTGADDLAAELRLRCAEAVGRRLALVAPDELADALLPVLHTPWGPDATTLATVAPADRLAELDFELPLAGGEHPTAARATLAAVAALVRRHLPADDPLAGYPDLLATVDAPPLTGYLGGSLDAVLRLPGPRYVVVDYKTNRLGRGDLTTGHYTREAMAQEMARAHYPLQALLYAVALHRYLRWRQPGYDPAVHLGGVAYLFVRGMVGPETPAGCGVFDWQPPAALVVELSDLLAGR